MGSNLIRHRAWFVARENFKNNTVEYLDDQRDVFYVEGVPGYATKAEAQERVDRYKGDVRNMFLVGPNYGRYKLVDARPAIQKQVYNTQLMRFKLMDTQIEQTKDTEAVQDLIDELRQLLHDFAVVEGLWYFQGIHRIKEFLRLVRKYNALSDAELIEVLYAFKE